MEATNLYWWHLSQALHDDPQLTALRTEIAVINPKVIDGFKRIYTDIPKTDALDARVIAALLAVWTSPSNTTSRHEVCTFATANPVSLSHGE
ncbi:hypothetical protein Psfp_02621 [Pelotomaculum sp. FP]|nr:hypothetical protein Psfp_02621 [Pelotomaculum sp. FP]